MAAECLTKPGDSFQTVDGPRFEPRDPVLSIASGSTARYFQRCFLM